MLGVINTLSAINQQRVRIRVTPAYLLSTEEVPMGFSIEIINLSAFPITISEVGFSVGFRKRLPISSPYLLSGGTLPCRLSPREAISVTFGPQNFPVVQGTKIGAAYARTACGRTIFGRSPAGRQFAKMIGEIAASR